MHLIWSCGIYFFTSTKLLFSVLLCMKLNHVGLQASSDTHTWFHLHYSPKESMVTFCHRFQCTDAFPYYFRIYGIKYYNNLKQYKKLSLSLSLSFSLSLSLSLSLKWSPSIATKTDILIKIEYTCIYMS